MDQTRTVGEQTIADFGEQWLRFPTHEGFYVSQDLLRDICEPLLPIEQFRGARVAEIGSGTGRIVEMILDAGAAQVTALEPSAAYDVLRQNLARHGARVSYIRATGDQLPAEGQFDIVVSIGVLHHIPSPASAVAAAYRALRPGGRMLIWLYGHEGNGAYLGAVTPLRWLTTRLPAAPTEWLARALNVAAGLYIGGCKVMPLPLRGYMMHVFGKFTPERRVQVIYDQLKPAYAKYYKQREAIDLLATAGFTDVQIHHRHGYSWTVLGVKST